MIEIWCEGDPKREYTACHLGYGKGANLLEACADLATRYDYFKRHFNPHSMTYCGCKVFDNEKDARDFYN